MKKTATMAVGGVLALTLVAGGAYWLGRNASHGATVAGSAAPAAKPAPKLLYYRNPMGLADTSPTPKQDSMGMDYIPVYEGEEEAGAASGQVVISTDKVQKLGVRTEAASLRPLGKVVRAVGRVEPDERRIYTIAPKFEGYVEKLHVNATGQSVGKGQALFEVYSPDLVTAQREYAIAAQGVQSLGGAGGEPQAAMKQLADASLLRLRNWDISAEQLRELARTGEARHSLTLRSPVSGVVTEKKAQQGMRFMPGEALYQVTDLGAVWVLADVFEQDIALVKLNAVAGVTLDAYPGQRFDGKISYIYPTMKADTRTVTVRVELANPAQLLKPGMFARVELAVPARGSGVTIPASAVIDSGTRRIALVQLAQGRYAPRELKLGMRSDDYVEVLEGIGEGEQVVVAANFLIDAESNLRAAVAAFGQGGEAKPAASHADHAGASGK